LLVLVVAAAACVYPTDAPTGIEFSWRFLEVEPSDGDEARRVITCAATGVETIAADIVDLADELRTGRFRYACDDGFQTAQEVARTASDAFLELRPSDYEVVLETDGPGVVEVELGRRTIEVLGRESTQSLWDLQLPAVEWNLAIAGAATCSEVSLGLFYADPEAALTEVPLDDEGTPLPVLYRAALASDRGLTVGAMPQACAELDGIHRFTGLDRGTYRLEIIVDGNACAFEVVIDGAASTMLDLAALPCA
jgi:hypothetical protein